MSSIIVKGMEMPELYETYKVNFAMTNDGKIVMGMCLLNETGYRPVGEVAALPDKHGRLGDLDALIRDHFSPEHRIALSEANKTWMRKIINDAPTIVEAEDSE